MPVIPVPHRKLSELSGTENFSKYAIDVDGTVWSLQYKRLKRLKPYLMKKCGFYVVYLKDDNKKPKLFYIHRLVMKAFCPTPPNTGTYITNHINGNKLDNRLINLEWRLNEKQKEDLNDYVLNNEMITRIQKVHLAAQIKGLKVGEEFDFTNDMIDMAVKDYIVRYGLRKVMPDL
jgi:uncharacterized coiled-coil protein SlyX